ncbi:hypothetical protein PSPO01_05712 [Paraphaeosphaeria sporulosa]
MRMLSWTGTVPSVELSNSCDVASESADMNYAGSACGNRCAATCGLIPVSFRSEAAI